MAEAIKLSEEEHSLLIGLQNRWEELKYRFGDLHYQKKSIKLELRQIDDSFEKLDAERLEVVKQLQDKYGVGHVNLLTGEFTPVEQETTPE